MFGMWSENMNIRRHLIGSVGPAVCDIQTSGGLCPAFCRDADVKHRKIIWKHLTRSVRSLCDSTPFKNTNVIKCSSTIIGFRGFNISNRAFAMSSMNVKCRMSLSVECACFTSQSNRLFSELSRDLWWRWKAGRCKRGENFLRTFQARKRSV